MWELKGFAYSQAIEVPSDTSALFVAVGGGQGTSNLGEIN